MRVQVSAVIRRPPESVCARYADYRNWPRLFRTISGVRVLSGDRGRAVLEIDHAEGTVVNGLSVRCPDQLYLAEVKRHYDALFCNWFLPAPEGTVLTVLGDIRFKGWARLLQPFLRGHVRRQIRRFQIEPLRQAVEGPHLSGRPAPPCGPRR